MRHTIIFWITFIVLFFLFAFLDKKYNMLRDSTDPKMNISPKPYSLALVQLGWWSIVILASFITVLFVTGNVPAVTNSTLILLGISTVTTATARLTDVSDQATPGIQRTQNENGQGILLDILSDKGGVSITRLQAVLFNITFGLWFIHEVLSRLTLASGSINETLPEIDMNNLILLGISSATYAGLKTTENK